tara:strand:- start:196 stop:345 length:150 start_codon:yes stop_codon:yes gene_type:complete
MQMSCLIAGFDCLETLIFNGFDGFSQFLSHKAHHAILKEIMRFRMKCIN